MDKLEFEAAGLEITVRAPTGTLRIIAVPLAAVDTGPGLDAELRDSHAAKGKSTVHDDGSLSASADEASTAVSDIEASTAPIPTGEAFRLARIQADILSALTPNSCCRAQYLAKAAGIPQGRLAPAMKTLVSAGLVEYGRFGTRSYGILLRAGLEHPQYDRDAPKAPVADLETDFGVVKLRFLQILKHLGTGCTNDIRAGLPSGYFGYSTVTAGNFTGQLKHSGYIEEIWPPFDRHATYRLTPMGEAFLRAITPYVSPPDPAALAAAKECRDRREEQRALLRGCADEPLIDYREVRKLPQPGEEGDEDA
ncbi:MAG TPA: hypothetical protein VHG92_07305 [Afifellaceae bacterium]|nr:hypothetical protein [Afifellaceae bacterium]